MPKNVRNFWVEVDVDGRKSNIATGPTSKDGGMNIILKVRNKGKVHEAGSIACYVDIDGMLIINSSISPREEYKR